MKNCNIIAFHLFLILSLQCHHSLAELAKVRTNRADLYRDSKINEYLNKDEIVHVKESKIDEDWFKVLFNNKVYESRKDNFRTKFQINSDYQKNKIAIETEMEKLNDKLFINNQLIRELYAGNMQVHWDRTVFYQLLLPGGKRSSHQKFDKIESANLIAEKSRIKRIEKISSLKSRKLLRKWFREIKKLKKMNAEINNRRSLLRDRLSFSQIEFKYFNVQLQKFMKSEKTYLRDLYLVSGRHTGLYENYDKKFELKNGDIVLAEFNRTHPDRLLVDYMGKWYDSSRILYKSRQEIEHEHVKKIHSLIAQINDAENEIDLLKFRERMIFDYKHDLAYAVNINHEFIFLRQDVQSFKNYAMPSDKYWIENPEGAREIVNTSRANNRIRKWEKELFLIQRDIELLWEKTEELKQQEAALEAKFEDLIYRFNNG